MRRNTVKILFLRKAALERFGRDDILAVIGIKAGTTYNTVNKVNNILGSENKDIIEQCRIGLLPKNCTS